MRVLVTGAAGFLGHAVAALLVEHGHQVTGLTRSPASALPTGVQRLLGDLCTPDTLPTALTEVEAVCHLAGLTKLRESRTVPLDYWRTNLGGTLTILDRLAPGGRVVLASSCTVYDMQAGQPISETAAVAPSSPYATSKLAADQAAADLAATGAISLRAVNVAGALPGHPVPRRHVAATHEPATLVADSTRIRSELGWRPEKSSLSEIISDAGMP